MRKVANYIPTLLVAGAIAYLSLATGEGLPHVDWAFPNIDKLIHLTMYTGLSLVLTLDMGRSGVSHRRSAAIAILASALYGGLLEIIQPYFPPRTCEWLDFAADCTGAVLGWAIAYFVWTRRHSAQQ